MVGCSVAKQKQKTQMWWVLAVPNCALVDALLRQFGDEVKKKKGRNKIYLYIIYCALVEALLRQLGDEVEIEKTNTIFSRN